MSELNKNSTVPKYEEAKRCPKCGKTGELGVKQPHERGHVETWICQTETCPWYKTGWVIQIARDGSIPDRRKGPKEFESLTPGQEAAARAYIEEAIQKPYEG